jgi:glycosyltransferase involved in cell wall biosynthesis
VALAAAMLRVLRDPILAERLSLQGRQFARAKLSMKAFGDNILRLYETAQRLFRQRQAK